MLNKTTNTAQTQGKQNIWAHLSTVSLPAKTKTVYFILYLKSRIVYNYVAHDVLYLRYYVLYLYMT